MSKQQSEMKKEIRDIYLDYILDYAKSDVKEKQVGGNHYQNKIQPWEIVDSWELNFYEGNVLKYLLRRKNNRIEDLQKMIHYAEKLLELELLK